MEIDKGYFDNYAGRGRSYDEVFEEHTYAPECIEFFKTQLKIHPKRICVFGTATGRVLEYFYEAFSVKPFGCEINAWAFEQVPRNFRSRIALKDMRDFVADCARTGKRFDLGFSNSFIYLEEAEIAPFLKALRNVCTYIHFCSSFSGNACEDVYRKTLKPLKWWIRVFQEAGFDVVPSRDGDFSYLYRVSTK